MAVDVYAKMRQRYDTAANWTLNNTVLLEGEIGIESDTRKFKFGNGTTAWNSLPYVTTSLADGSIDDLGDVDIALNEAPSNGRVLMYQDGKWVASPPVIRYISSTGTDTSFNQVSLLLHLNGANNSTTLTDFSSTPKTPSAVSGFLSTARSKFGSAALTTSSASNAVLATWTNAYPSQLSRPFTIECWLYRPSGLNNTSGIYILGAETWGRVNIYFTSANQIEWEQYGIGVRATTSEAVPLDTWFHFAVTWSDSNVVTLWINGASKATFSNSSSVGNNSQLALYGSLNHFIDEFRLTLGVDRYPSTFTPPTTAFPDQITGATPAFVLDALSDVDTTTTAPTNGQALIWDAATATWKPGTVASGSGGSSINSIDDITDVDIAALQPASDGRALIYQNGKWIAGPVIGGFNYTPANGEPLYSSVQLLLHMEGADNGTTFTDNSPSPRTITRTSVVTSTEQKKFGTASLKSNGSGYLRLPAITLSGDFTIECWFYANNIANDICLFGGTSGNTQILRFNSDGSSNTIRVYVDGDRLPWSNNYASGLTSAQWHHIALTRSGTTLRLFVNGNNVTGNSVTWSGSFSFDTVGAGYLGSSNAWNGYIDEVRVSNIARYTSNFGVPSQPFADASANAITGKYSINNLEDVDTSTSSPTNGQALVWDQATSQWRPGNPTAAVGSLDDVADVDVAALQAVSNGRALIYFNGKWIAGPEIGGYTYNESAADPSFSSVSLLLHFDGAAGSTTITDSSSNNVAINRFGNSQLSTTHSKFGGSALYLDGSGDYLTFPSNSLFSFDGNFTVEMWVRREAVTGPYETLLELGSYANGLMIRPGDSIVYANGASAGSFSLSLNTWHHIAVVRIGSAITVYKDGVSVGTMNVPGVINSGNSVTYLGDSTHAPGRYFQGWIDELRISKVARYTSNFTPPTAAFPGNTILSKPFSINNLEDVDTQTSTPSAGASLKWDSTTSQWRPSPTNQIVNVTYATTTLNVGAGENFTISAGNTYQLLSFTASAPVWIRVYGTAAARSADLRMSPGGTPPAAGTDFFAELVTTSTPQTIRLSPVPTVQSTAGLTYVRVINKSTSSQSITLTFTVLTLDA